MSLGQIFGRQFPIISLFNASILTLSYNRLFTVKNNTQMLGLTARLFSLTRELNLSFKKLILFTSFFASLGVQAVTLTFSYWPYEQEGCNNIRDQFLQQNAIKPNPGDTTTPQLVMGCNVVSGRWKDSFTDETIDNASEIIVAPVVPLDFIKPYTKLMSFQRLFSFAHDQSLFVLFKKGGQGEKMYLANKKVLTSLPTRPNARCELIGQWMDAKARWNLPMSTEEKNSLVNDVALCQSGDEYNRTETFGGWTTLLGKSCNTRVEILKRDSKIAVTPEAGDDRPCTPRLVGQWEDPYTGKTFTDAHDMDIDHVVPLKHAYISGAWKWASTKKREYANDMSNLEHLVAVDSSANRSKGDAPPQLWMPPNLKFHCTYLTRWLSIKFRWGLTIDQNEKLFLTTQLKNCRGTDYKRQVDIINLLANAQIE